jgi:hypothetical protein
LQCEARATRRRRGAGVAGAIRRRVLWYRDLSS